MKVVPLLLVRPYTKNDIRALFKNRKIFKKFEWRRSLVYDEREFVEQLDRLDVQGEVQDITGLEPRRRGIPSRPPAVWVFQSGKVTSI